jgi:hypothetical protein
MLKLRSEQVQALADGELTHRIARFLRAEAKDCVSNFSKQELFDLTSLLLQEAKKLRVNTEREIAKFVLIGLITDRHIFEQEKIVSYLQQTEGDDLRVDRLLRRVALDLPG